jgi:hypothetical protein
LAEPAGKRESLLVEVLCQVIKLRLPGYSFENRGAECSLLGGYPLAGGGYPPTLSLFSLSVVAHRAMITQDIQDILDTGSIKQKVVPSPELESSVKVPP